MHRFSCYVDVERFLGQPVKDLAQFLCCLPQEVRHDTIVLIADFFKHINHQRDFFRFEKSREREIFFERLPLNERDTEILWELILSFFKRHAENASGKPIPQDDLIALRKGRLFEEILYRIGPVRREKVELVCMHCQPMVDRKKLPILCQDKDLSSKNIDLAFWGRDYVEAYECKSNVSFFLRMAMGHGEKAKKVRDKLRYLNALALTLEKYFGHVEVVLASFTTDRDYERFLKELQRWVFPCGKKLLFKIKTIDEILNEVTPCLP